MSACQKTLQFMKKKTLKYLEFCSKCNNVVHLNPPQSGVLRDKILQELNNANELFTIRWKHLQLAVVR